MTKCPCCKNEFTKHAIQRQTEGAQKYTIFTCPVCDILVAIPYQQQQQQENSDSKT
jgi:RNase P subunit RPR2